MTIKSLFVPPYAMQGEEIPAHILWESLDYDLIKIVLPEVVKLKAVYNVGEKMFNVSDRTVTINEVEVEGYLGMLFSTGKLKEHSIRVPIRFSFINKDGKTIFDKSKMVHLFRPELEIIEIPETIRFFPEKRYISNKIKLRKIGKGRMIIAFNIPNESQLQKLTPDDIQEFLEKVDRNLELNFINIKKSFPQYANQLDQYRFYVINGWTNYEQLSEYKKVSTEILIAAIEDETFARLFIDALAKSLTTDVKLVTIPENFLKYLNSILSKKLWLLRPWESIPVSTDSQKLMIEIVPTDLLLDEYEIIRLGPIEVLADCDGSIEISRLFEWRE